MLISNADLRWIPAHASLFPLLMHKSPQEVGDETNFHEDGKTVVPAYKTGADELMEGPGAANGVLDLPAYFDILSGCSSAFTPLPVFDHQALAK